MHDKKNNRISAEQNRAWIRKISFGGLLLSIGIVLPQVFHLTGGPTSGATFLPMHIPVLIAGLLLGPVFEQVSARSSDHQFDDDRNASGGQNAVHGCGTCHLWFGCGSSLPCLRPLPLSVPTPRDTGGAARCNRSGAFDRSVYLLDLAMFAGRVVTR